MLTNLNQPVLVMGGAGFIGSHMMLALEQAGVKAVALDNLTKGHRDALLGAALIVGEMGDRELLQQIFSTHQFSAVMHFASFIEVEDSVKDPAKFYQNNVAATLTLLDVMRKNNVQHFIFSSTAAVYGEPRYTPIDEKHPLSPINPYGRSKWMVEQIVQDYAASYGLKYAILRYFNAAGADPKGRISEQHEPESHLIPLILQVASGKKKNITIYGRDYKTEDGTCVRDYIHVVDLCQAHLLALKVLLSGKKNIICNLGTGQGYSVQQVIDVATQVTKCPIRTVEGSRRLGDPAILVANATYAKKELGWQPCYVDLEIIIQHAWKAGQLSR